MRRWHDGLWHGDSDDRFPSDRRRLDDLVAAGWQVHHVTQGRTHDEPAGRETSAARESAQALSRKASRTPTPNCSDSTGTRSSTPWNSEVKSRSGGSCSGANP